MRTMLRIATIVAIVLCSGALRHLQAGGVGVYSGITAGMQDLKYGSAGSGVMESIQGMKPGSASVAASGSNTAFALGFGIVYDTAAAKDKIFNYRLNIGYANMFYSNINPFDTGTYHMVTWSNTFGIGFFRRSMVRLWAGPLLGVSYQVRTFSQSTSFVIVKFNTEYQIHHVNFYGGAVFGVNINPGDHFTLSFECGIQGGGGIGKVVGGSDASLLSLFKFNLPGNSSTSSTNVEFISRLSFMYRVGDTFAAPVKKTVPVVQPPDEKKTTPAVPAEPDKKSEPEKKAEPEKKPVAEVKPEPVKEEKPAPRPADPVPGPAPAPEKKPAQ